MWNSIKICYVSFFWNFSGKKINNITYIGLFGIFLFGFSGIFSIIFIESFGFSKISIIGILITLTGIFIVYTCTVALKILPELPEIVVPRIGKLLVYRTEIPSNSDTDKEFITILKELLPIYVSSQKNEDFIKLRNVYINYCEYSNRSRELLSENSH